MSYHRIPTRVAQPFHLLVEAPRRGLHGEPMPAPFTPTTAFAQAVDPYTWRFSPPSTAYSPYGWGPDMNIGMPFNYTHHIGYERTPIPGARRVGPMYDVLPAAGLGRVGYDEQTGRVWGGCMSQSPRETLAYVKSSLWRPGSPEPWYGPPPHPSSGGYASLAGILAVL